MDENVVLYIPYSEKDGAKLLGAKWNMEGKYWYSTRKKVEGSDLEKYSVKPEKLFYRIQFNRKDEAKLLGAKWDPECGSWYGLSNNIPLYQNFRMYADVPKGYKNPHIVREKQENTPAEQIFPQGNKEAEIKSIPYFDVLRDSNLYL